MFVYSYFMFIILCVVCLVYKRYTDNEAIRVFYHLEKISREWPLLNNITWDENGALLADVSFGGFILITLGLLVGQVSGELRRARRLNCFFMVLGCILFLIVGGLCLASVDQVPQALVDNAIILGILSIVTGLLFLLDLAFTGNKKSAASAPTMQGKKPITTMVSAPQVVEKKPEVKKDSGKEVDETKAKKNFGNGMLKELRSSLKKKKIVEDLDGRGVVVEKPDKNVEFETVKDSDVETEQSQKTGDDNRQYGRRRLENRGFTRTASDDSGRFSSDRFRNDFVDAERDRRFDRDFDRFDSRNVSLIEGAYDGRRSRGPNTREVELDEHYLRPQDYYIEKKPTRDKQHLQDQRVSSSRQDFSDDEDLRAQLPSVSFLLSERGRKVQPNISASPLERLQEVTSTTPVTVGKPRYYYNSSRDPASGSSTPTSPRTPGYVRHAASQWEGEPGDKERSTISEKAQQWYRNRQNGKAP